MNQKYFIPFTLLVFCFLINVEETHGCHPIGQWNCGDEDFPCGAQITGVKWLPDNKMNITVSTPTKGYPPEALGHFTFSNGKSFNGRILTNPVFVNTHDCAHEGPNEVNPFESPWEYEAQPPPSSGDIVDIWISVYWDCAINHLNAIFCIHEDIHNRFTVP